MSRFILDNKITLDNDKIDTYQIKAMVDTETKAFYFIIDDLVNIELFVERLNKLDKRNNQLKKALNRWQSLTINLLDFIKEKDTVTHQEVKDWWNKEVMKK